MSGLSKTKAEPREMRELWHHEGDEYIIDMAWSPNGQTLAAVTVEGQVLVLLDANQRGQSLRLGSHALGATSLAWRFDSAQFATTGQDGLVKVWEPATSSPFRELPAGGKWAAKVAYRPGKRVLASAADKRLKIWSDDGKPIYESDDHASTIADIGWNPDGSAVAVAAYNGVTLHVPGKQARPRKFEWKGSSLVLAWSPNSRFIVTGEQDSTVHFWHVKTGKDSQMWGFPTKVLEVAWHHRGERLVTGGSDTIVLWDCSGKGPEDRKPKMFEAHPAKITQLAFQYRGDLLASSDNDGFLFVWNPLKQKLPVAGQIFSSSISRLAWSPDDRLLAVGQQDGTITVLQNDN